MDGQLIREQELLTKKREEAAAERAAGSAATSGARSGGRTGGSTSSGEEGEGDSGFLSGGVPQTAEGGDRSGGGGAARPGTANEEPLTEEEKARIPDDVGDGSDDDIVARQLREAAIQEEDPELREKLWEEYRRYKTGSKTAD